VSKVNAAFWPGSGSALLSGSTKDVLRSEDKPTARKAKWFIGQAGLGSLKAVLLNIDSVRQVKRCG
jgi:hypothetical protein